MYFSQRAHIDNLLADPLRATVQDAKWRVTTLMQRMEKLQVELDEAIEEEKRVVAAAEKFIETGEIPEDFLPDLDKSAVTMSKWSRKGVDAQNYLRLAALVNKALRDVGAEGWILASVDKDYHSTYMTFYKSNEPDKANLRYDQRATKFKLEECVEAYHNAWRDKKTPRECTQAAVEMFYAFDGSDPPDLADDLYTDFSYDKDTFKGVVAFDHRDWELPLRPRGRAVNAFQIRKGQLGHDPPH